MVALRTRATTTTTTATPVAGDINNWRASSSARERDSAQIYDTLLNDSHCIYLATLSLFLPFFLPFSEGTAVSQYAVQLVAASLSIADLAT